MSFAKNMDKNTGENIIKNLSNKCNQKRLDHAKQFTIDALKTTSKKYFKKQQKKRVIFFALKLLIGLQISQEVHLRIIQKQFQINMANKYLKKDIYIYIYIYIYIIEGETSG